MRTSSYASVPASLAKRGRRVSKLGLQNISQARGLAQTLPTDRRSRPLHDRIARVPDTFRSRPTA